MRKPTICLCENKDADQLRGNREADQRLCFRYTDSTVPLLLKSKIQNFKPLAIFCACTARFVSDLVRNPNCWFSHAQAHLSTSKIMSRCYMYLHFMGLTQNEDVLTCGEHKTRTGCLHINLPAPHKKIISTNFYFYMFPLILSITVVTNVIKLKLTS